MGRSVGERVARRFGKSILELGGNNASIVTPSADLELTLRAVAFGAMGTAGQRCTTMRRLIVHSDVYDRLVPKLIAVYRTIPIGEPRSPDTLFGPPHDADAFTESGRALDSARSPGGTVQCGDSDRTSRGVGKGG